MRPRLIKVGRSYTTSNILTNEPATVLALVDGWVMASHGGRYKPFVHSVADFAKYAVAIVPVKKRRRPA